MTPANVKKSRNKTPTISSWRGAKPCPTTTVGMTAPCATAQMGDLWEKADHVIPSVAVGTASIASTHLSSRATLCCSFRGNESFLMRKTGRARRTTAHLTMQRVMVATAKWARGSPAAPAAIHRRSALSKIRTCILRMVGRKEPVLCPLKLPPRLQQSFLPKSQPSSLQTPRPLHPRRDRRHFLPKSQPSSLQTSRPLHPRRDRRRDRRQTQAGQGISAAESIPWAAMAAPTWLVVGIVKITALRGPRFFLLRERTALAIRLITHVKAHPHATPIV